MSSGMVPVTTGISKSRLWVHSVRLFWPEAPGVALVLDVAQHEPGLGRELGLHEDLVTAHVDDGVDVLDVDRALLDAGAAGGARPQDIGVDDVGHESGLLALAGEQRAWPRRTCCRAGS